MTVPYRERCPGCGERRVLFPTGPLRLCVDCLRDRPPLPEAKP